MEPLIPAPLLGRLFELWHPQEVWLFGSRAKGTPRQDSDWDVLLVVSDDTSDEWIDLNTAWLRVRDLKIPVDVFPMRRSEFDSQRVHLGSLAQIATSQGARVASNNRTPHLTASRRTERYRQLEQARLELV